MGNYSYLEDQDGCEIDEEKLKLLCLADAELNKVYQDCLETLEREGRERTIKHSLGAAINGWKIQGYWYGNFCKFIWVCAQCMPHLTEDKGDNLIRMEEEQGFAFTFFFFIDEDTKQPKVEVDYIPMEWNTLEITPNGHTVDV